ncbi:MAG: pyruvate ferredoxin oxidoreductase [Aestuariibacter sp.]|nr:pyruvate ferredoxin oxidoreductase [Aestuariibacter sp.]
MSETQIRFSGSGGQGLQLASKILASALAHEGRSISMSQSYEPTSRGGLSRSDLVVDSSAGYPLVTEIDFLIILDQLAVENSVGLIGNNARVIIDIERVDCPPAGEHMTTALPLIQGAREVGNIRAANVVALGAILAISSICAQESRLQAIHDTVPARFLDLNLEAFKQGYGLVVTHRNAKPQLTAVN